MRRLIARGRTWTEDPAVDAALKTVVWIVICFALYQAIFIPYVTQWDFKLYLSCAKALKMGINPYNENQMKLGLGYYWDMPCLYSPIALNFYRPFVAISPGLYQYTSQLMWCGLKLSWTIALIGLWKLYFIDIEYSLFYLLYFSLAYGSPFLVDIRAGNIAIFEQLLLWSSFALLLHGYDALFALLVIIAAQAKLTPALFLPLILVHPKPRWGLFFLACAAFVGTLYLNKVIYPELTLSFIDQLRAGQNSWWNESGILNCSSFAFLKDCAALTGPASSVMLKILIALFVPSILYSSGKAIVKRLRAARIGWAGHVELILFYCTIYALLMPRFKDYSYALMLAPTAYIWKKVRSEGFKYTLLFFVFANSAKTQAVHLGLGPFANFFSYFKLYAVFLTWLAYLEHLKGAKQTFKT